MLRAWLDRLQALWVQNTRNRIVIMISTAVVAVLLLCGCLNLLGVLGGGLVDSLLASGPPARPTLVTGTQVVNVNPTFPLPTPTVYPYPPSTGGTPVPSSNTPAPTPTPSPTPVVTDTPPPDGTLQFIIQPDPNGFKAGRTNQIILIGPPGTVVGVSITLVSFTSCVLGNAPNDPVTLDQFGHGSFSCDIPINLKGSTATLQIQPNTGQPFQQDYPVN
jgi:hypothetical protein